VITDVIGVYDRLELLGEPVVCGQGARLAGKVDFGVREWEIGVRHREPFQARQQVVGILEVGGPTEPEAEPVDEHERIEFHAQVQFSVLVVFCDGLVTGFRHIDGQLLPLGCKHCTVTQADIVARHAAIGDGADIQCRADFGKRHPVGQFRENSLGDQDGNQIDTDNIGSPAFIPHGRLGIEKPGIEVIPI